MEHFMRLPHTGLRRRSSLGLLSADWLWYELIPAWSAETLTDLQCPYHIRWTGHPQGQSDS